MSCGTEHSLQRRRFLPRYNHSFKKLWAFCKTQGSEPSTHSMEEAASWLLKFAKLSPNDARNAYAGMLLLPEWSQFRFCPIIKHCKQVWKRAGDKYSDFWDARCLLSNLAKAPLNWKDAVAVRDQAILVMKIFHLCRSVDLARTYRRRATLNGQVFISIRRKGTSRPRFEQLMRLQWKNISPACLLERYVSLTRTKADPGSSLFLSARSPFKPLSANTIGSITKRLLKKFQIPVGAFGAHSTRGAAVKFFKSLGLSSEQVCELGSWKNAQAFTNHYLRVGAAGYAARSINKILVHTVPSKVSAEHERSCSPGSNYDLGRSDLECEARNQDGTCSYLAGMFIGLGFFAPRFLLTAFRAGSCRILTT